MKRSIFNPCLPSEGWNPGLQVLSAPPLNSSFRQNGQFIQCVVVGLPLINAKNGGRWVGI